MNKSHFENFWADTEWELRGSFIQRSTLINPDWTCSTGEKYQLRRVEKLSFSYNHLQDSPQQTWLVHCCRSISSQVGELLIEFSSSFSLLNSFGSFSSSSSCEKVRKNFELHRTCNSIFAPFWCNDWNKLTKKITEESSHLNFVNFSISQDENNSDLSDSCHRQTT